MLYPLVIDTSSTGRKSESERIRQLLMKHPNVVEADLYQLFGAGDYLMFTRDGYTLGIEHKAANDLFSSMTGQTKSKDSRIVKQISALVGAFDLPVLAIKGRIDRTLDGRVSADGRRREWWYSYYSMWQFKQNTKLWFLADDPALVRGFVSLRDWLSTVNLDEVLPYFSMAVGLGAYTERARKEFNFGQHE